MTDTVNVDLDFDSGVFYVRSVRQTSVEKTSYVINYLTYLENIWCIDAYVPTICLLHLGFSPGNLVIFYRSIDADTDTGVGTDSSVDTVQSVMHVSNNAMPTSNLD